MSIFANQNNVYVNGTFISGATSATTGVPFRTQGLGKISFVVEGLNNPSFTGIIQATVHPSQSVWVNLFSTGFNAVNGSGAALLQTLGQFDAIRVVVNPYSAGICNVWFTASQT